MEVISWTILSPALRRFAPHLVVAVVVILLAVVLIPQGLPCPRVDDAFYKSPAAELVQHGRLAIPCCIGFLPRAEAAFACYPPGYQGVLAAWYWLFGVSLYSSLAFSFSVHLLGALAVTEISLRLLQGRSSRALAFNSILAAAVGLIYAANLAYFDRQEETALLWLWLEMLCFRADRSLTWRRSIASGCWLGLAGLTSPFVGVLGVTLIGIRNLVATLQTRPNELIGALLRLMVTGASAGALAVVWYVAMESAYPGIMEDQFFWLMAHLKRTQNLGSFSRRLSLILATILYNPPQLPAAILVLSCFPLALRRIGWRDADPLGVAVYGAGLIGLTLLVLFRPTAYTYLGATLMLLLPCLAPAVANLGVSDLQRGAPKWSFAAAVVIGCLIPAYRHATMLVATTLQDTADRKASLVISRLRFLIPEGERVAVTARHWHAFQGRNPWREAYFSSVESADEVVACQWLVLDSESGLPPFIDHFELVEQVPVAASARQSYAYSLWRRKNG